ncbi:hypothetical protein B0H14DRAFT_1408720 [Mycena olivaceomarginata]|nr:hypothetical protein B0H14DRAFT_1408720 [Mycena olivaceomarginata]
MAPARLSCIDPICARLVKRTSGDMIISGRVYVFGNDSLDVYLRVLPLAPTTPALTLGNPVGVRLRTHNLARPAHALVHKPSGASSSPTVIPSPRRPRQYPLSTPPPPPTIASLLPPTQSRFTPVAAQLPHATTPSSSACSRARLNRRLRHNPSHPAVQRRALPSRTSTVG